MVRDSSTPYHQRQTEAERIELMDAKSDVNRQPLTETGAKIIALVTVEEELARELDRDKHLYRLPHTD